MFIRRFQLIGLLVLCFLVGAVIGTVYESFASGSSRQKHVRLSDMAAKLDLSADQKNKLDKVLAEGRKCMVDLSKTYRPEFEKVKKTTRTEIKALLTDAQRKEFDRMLSEQQDRRHRFRRPRSQGNQTK